MVSVKSVIRRAARAVRFGAYDHRKVFEHIYSSRYWGDRESVSGVGSSLAQTECIREELPKLIKQYDIKSMFDAPCGDLHWMRKILEQVDIDYIGGDVVPAVVEMAAANYAGKSASFRVFDIVNDSFPDVDLWLCRDVLFHLSYANIIKSLKNFSNSNIKYILVTTHTATSFVNRNVVTGDFRQLNLFKAPFSLPESAVLYRFDDYAPPHNPREMVLIKRQDIAAAMRGK